MLEFQFDKDGFYTGSCENPTSTPSYRSTRTTPVFVAGHIPKWNGSEWGEQVENHKGEKVYVNGEPYEITEYGPYPNGWSDSPPPPSLEEAKAAKLAEINQAKWTTIENGEVEYSGLHFQTNNVSQEALTERITLHQTLEILHQVWRAKDGYLQVTAVSQLTDIRALIEAFVQTQIMREYELTPKINAATTVETVEAIHWGE